MGGVFFAADADGVAGVCAAAVADYDVGAFGDKVDDFTFAFVTPLESDDARIFLLERNHSGWPFQWLRRTNVDDGKYGVGVGVSSVGNADCRLPNAE